MKKYIAVPVIAVLGLAVTATGAYAAARGFDRADANAQAVAGSSTCLGKKPTIVGSAVMRIEQPAGDGIIGCTA